ncbi:MAG: Transglutaminase-like superfamily [Chloroflexi bacterium]|nr:Transglutaminase-like superfamily [Chloroflexota bacterium]
MSDQNKRGRLSWSERWFALRSIFILHLISFFIRRFGFAAVYRWMVGIGNRRFKSLVVPCLPESLTVWWFLRRKGIDAHLLLGVRKAEPVLPDHKPFDGHAWVEVNNRVVSGDPDLAGQFTPLNLD